MSTEPKKFIPFCIHKYCTKISKSGRFGAKIYESSKQLIRSIKFKQS